MHMLCKSLFVLLYFFFWPLCCLFFIDIRILMNPLVSSSSSQYYVLFTKYICLHYHIALLKAYILMIGLYIFTNNIQWYRYFRFVRLLKAFSSITDISLFCSCLSIVNKCIYQSIGLLIYFKWIIGSFIFLFLLWIILELRYLFSCFE
jgi:hypothetical protein